MLYCLSQKKGDTGGYATNFNVIDVLVPFIDCQFAFNVYFA